MDENLTQQPAMTRTGGPVSETAPLPGLLFVLVGPAGVGKNTIIRPVMGRIPALRRLPTATTRPPRPDEQEGREHFFVTQERFEAMVAENVFIEHQQVHPGKYYGTPRQTTETALRCGHYLIADIDILGAQALKRLFPENVITIFVSPPSIEVLSARLHERGNMPEQEIRDRLRRAQMEMDRAHECDHIVINDTLEQAVEQVTAIIRQELARRVTA